MKNEFLITVLLKIYVQNLEARGFIQATLILIFQQTLKHSSDTDYPFLLVVFK